MSIETELEELRRDVRYLKDRAAVLDCIATHARGCDRHDVTVLTSAYHDDSIDEHGTANIPGPEYAAWANAAHAATSDTHLHNITTHTCEIDGDEAHAESYVLVTLLANDGKTATMMCGRYIDRLERRDGAWRIAVRRSTVELAFTADSSLLQFPFFKDLGYIKGTRDRDDLSYQRPLSMQAPAARWQRRVGKSVGIAAGVPAGAWAGGNGAIGEDGFFAAFEENAVWGDLDLVALEAREATSYDILRKGMVASLTSYRSSGDAQSLACSRAGFDP